MSKKENKLKGLVSPRAGIVAIVSYVPFLLAARLNYPTPFSPFTNWLSDLGNRTTNPDGAAFYNAGAIVVAAILIPFFLGLSRWQATATTRKWRVLLRVAQGAGILTSAALIMTAIFTIGASPLTHWFWAIMCFFSIGAFQLFSAISLIKHPSVVKPIAGFGFASVTMALLWGVLYDRLFPKGFFGEWLSIIMFLIYIILVAYNSSLLTRKATQKIALREPVAEVE
jgi:hypothetical protein